MSGSLLLPVGLLVAGALTVVFRRAIGRSLRFTTLNDPLLRGWGYWEKLMPNEHVAASLEEMLALLTGALLILLGLIGIVAVSLGAT